MAGCLSSSKTCSYILQLLLLTAYIHPAFSIPHSLSTRQHSLAAFQIPSCALTCFVNSILADGCANETDFACHCASGDIIGAATACIEQGCDKADENDAVAKVQAGCRALGGNVRSGNKRWSSIGGFPSTRASSSTTTGGPSSSTTMSGPSSSAAVPTSASQSLPNSSGDIGSQPTPTSTPPNGSPSASPSLDSGPPTASPPSPTDMPLALLPPSDQLSLGAKIGIAISVSFFALSVFFALGWYIRRLKRELKAAQRAAAMIPDDVWRASIATAEAPGSTIEQQSSSGRGRRLSRHGGPQSPVSPLSPRNMEEIMTVVDNGYGVLKKKRGHVLSVVVEREEEDSSSMDRIIREPVPGQREGLSGPLELDGEYTGIFELPIAITPRERSVER